MTVKEALHKRFSCRHFLDTPVKKEVLDEIFQDAFCTPSWANSQPWSFLKRFMPAKSGETWILPFKTGIFFMLRVQFLSVWTKICPPGPIMTSVRFRRA